MWVPATRYCRITSNAKINVNSENPPVFSPLWPGQERVLYILFAIKQDFTPVLLSFQKTVVDFQEFELESFLYNGR